MENGIFRDGGCGYHCESIPKVNTSNLNTQRINSHDRGGVFYQNVIDGEIGNSICTDNYIGIQIKDRFEGETFNNYISKNNIGIKILYFLGTIRNNQLEENQIDINYANNMEYEEKGIKIINNNIYSDFGIKYFIAPNYVQYCGMNIWNNNFKSAEMFIEYYSRYFEENQKIHATHNYFNGITSIDEIGIFINDLWDDDLDAIILEPIESSLISNTGIM